MLLFEVGFVEIQGMATVILFALCFYLLTELREIRRDLKLRQPASDKNNILSILPIISCPPSVRRHDFSDLCSLRVLRAG